MINVVQSSLQTMFCSLTLNLVYLPYHNRICMSIRVKSSVFIISSPYITVGMQSSILSSETTIINSDRKWKTDSESRAELKAALRQKIGEYHGTVVST